MMIFLLLTAIVAIIVLSYTFIRSCFLLFGAFSTLFQELLEGAQDFDLKTSIIEIPSFSTCATAIAQTILRISIVFVRACANAFLSLVWPIVDLEAARTDLQAYAKFLVATYGPRKALPASPTWPSSTIGDSKWIPSFGYGGVMAFSSATIPAFPAIPQIWVHHIEFGATMPLRLPAPPVEAPESKKWLVMKILMALALIPLSFGTLEAAFLWITKVMVLFALYVMLRGIIQLVNRVFTTGRNVLFHRQRDDLLDNDHEEEAMDVDSVSTIETFSESVSHSLEDNDSFHGSPCEIVLVLFR